MLATEGDTGDLGQLVLRAIAAGRTKHGEIEQAVRAEPARTLERLIEAFRSHLRRLAAEGALAPDVVRIGAFWSERPAVEIDAVALAGRREEAVLLGEAKWARTADDGHLIRELESKASALPLLAPDLRYAACARERVTGAPSGTMVVTACDIFAG